MTCPGARRRLGSVIGALVLFAVLAVATLAGLVWQRRNGRMRRATPTGASAAADGPDPTPEVLGTLGVDASAAPVTLVQFSSAFCAPCRATRGILGQVVSQLPAVRHVEVDAESHLDAVRALRIMRTPTVLVVDRAGREVNRASGQPRMAEVIAAVAPYL